MVGCEIVRLRMGSSGRARVGGRKQDRLRLSWGLSSGVVMGEEQARAAEMI